MRDQEANSKVECKLKLKDEERPVLVDHVVGVGVVLGKCLQMEEIACVRAQAVNHLTYWRS